MNKRQRKKVAKRRAEKEMQNLVATITNTNHSEAYETLLETSERMRDLLGDLVKRVTAAIREIIASDEFNTALQALRK